MEKFEKEINELFMKHGIKDIFKRRPKKKCPDGKEPVEIIINGKKRWVCR